MKGGENMNQKSIIITIVVAVVIGGLAFFGGMQYQKGQTSAAFGSGFGARQGGFAGRFGGRAGMMGNGAMATSGKIVSTSGNSITVQLSDGSSKIVNFSSSTRIVKSQTGTPSDLTTGTQVAVFGTTNSDGSVTAENIQVNPMSMRVTPAPTQ